MRFSITTKDAPINLPLCGGKTRTIFLTQGLLIGRLETPMLAKVRAVAGLSPSICRPWLLWAARCLGRLVSFGPSGLRSADLNRDRSQSDSSI
ncbi:hypothetical protein PS634_04307 [Pseudomonas fluorescens]|nr:hypothetical protein PS634_04307 [Pseudomonas fluorescens]